jgi:DNA-binding GntR family transcriptional regulator
MPGAATISRSVLAEQVRDHLLEDILAGRYPPNTRIVETRIARELGTSQAPVREALRGLEALGVVEILPFRGARVRHPSAEELLGAYTVRAELESLGVRLGVPRMTDQDLEELEALMSAMERGAAGGDRHEVAMRDAAFHGRLMRLAGNHTLERVWGSLEPFSRTYLTLVAPGADVHWTAGLHPPILEALRRRDPAAVEAAIRHHFMEASSRLLAGWQEADGSQDGTGRASAATGRASAATGRASAATGRASARAARRP